MAEPARPASRNAISTGPSSFVIDRPTIGPRISCVTFSTCSAACTTSTMPTKSERSAPIHSVSTPTRTICATTRCRSIGTKRTVRSVAAKRRLASPSTCNTSRTPVPRRANGRTRGADLPTASTAIGLVLGRVRRELDVPGGDHPTVLARDEPPEERPVAGAVGPGVPAKDAVERRPVLDHAAVPRQQAVEERRGLAEASPVLLLAAQHGKQRQQPLVVAGRLVGADLPPPDHEAHVAPLVVEVVHVLRLRPVRRPGVETGGDAVHVAPTVNGERSPDLVLVFPEPPLPDDERPGRAGVLDPAPLVDGVRIREQAVRAGSPSRAVDRREEREVDAPALPAVAGHEPLGADVERPDDVAAALATGDLGRAVEREDPEAAAFASADARHEGERVVAALDQRLGQPEIRGKHDRPDVLVAEDVVEIEVEREHAETRPVLGALAVENERIEVEPARPLRWRRRLAGWVRGTGRRQASVREKEKAKG